MKNKIAIGFTLLWVSYSLQAFFQNDTFPNLPETFLIDVHTMEDFTPADPAEGIMLIDPPIPNHLGTANLSYEIKIPKGRGSMSPDITITYNSANYHSWLGHGWDMVLSSIDTDTRWGVPRYDADKESETYMLDGHQLTPVAHRDVVENRSSEKQFYPRVEGDFMKIIRHGDRPNNYWWEITEKNGNKNFYGGSPSGGLDVNAVLRDESGNIATWYLTKIMDLNGNNIIYEYNEVKDPGIAGSNNNGVQVYPSAIYYTGYGDEKGPYQVTFVRDRQLGDPLRTDIDIDANNGFKVVTADLLREIEVYFDGQWIRTFTLHYETGQFNKTLLASVSEFDNTGAKFYTHEMEYYNDLESSTPYASQRSLNYPSDNLKGNIINPIPGFTGNISALGGTNSNSFSGGSALTVGVIGNLATKDLTAGGSFHITKASGEGVVTLIDLNGDNLPDKVFRKSGKLYYRKNLGPSGDYGEKAEIKGITQFSQFSSSGTTVGIEAHPPLSFVGANFDKSKTNIEVYFTDYNGDGLNDIVQKGKVYFNHINSNGDPEFTLNSGDTPNPINTGAPIDMDVFGGESEDQEELENQFPLHDVVKLWKAPFDGNISINAPIRLLQDLSEEGQQYPFGDGVKVSIQAGNSVMWSTTINPDDYSVQNPTGVNDINVNAGDMIYFRVHSRYDGAYDLVNWNPIIQYNGQSSDSKDANAKPSFRYKASDDFLLASCQMIKMPFTGQVRIEGQLDKPITSDDVNIRVYQIIGGIKLPVYNQLIPWDSTFSGNIVIDSLNVIKNIELLFSIHSSTNVDWSAIEWAPRLYYTRTNPEMAVFDENGRPTIDLCPAPEYIMYNKTIQLVESFVLESNEVVNVDVFIARLPIRLQNTPSVFTIKTINGLIYKQEFRLLADIGVNYTFENIPIPGNDSIFIEVHIPDWEQGQYFEVGSYEVYNDSIDIDGDAGIYTGIHEDDLIFGNLYRGWGQFIYNGNNGRGNQAIDQSLLTLENEDIDPDFDYEGVEDPDDLDGSYNPTESVFQVMIADPKTSAWRGSDDLTYVKKDIISSSRMGEDNILIENQVSSGTGATAPTLIINSKLEAIAGGLGSGPVSGTVSKAWATTTNIIDFKDFNGDGYPDIVTGKSIQYTNPRGGLEGKAITHNLGNHVATSEAVGFTLGGSFAHSSPTNSGGTAGSGSVKRVSKRKSRTNKSAGKSKSATKSSKGSIGLSGSYTDDNDEASHSWLDINGDGLPDKIFKGGKAALNYGYRFGPREDWGFNHIRKGVSKDFGAGVGINISNGSIAGGISSSRTEYSATHALQDINGDGLIDIVVSADPMMVSFNNGNGFARAVPWEGITKLDEGTSTGESVNAAFTVCVPIPIIFVKVCVNPSTSVGRGVDRPHNEISDINNDGFPDILISKSDGELKVKTSNIGRTNLLKTIKRPLGSVITIDYNPIVNDYNNPNTLWAFTDLEVYDGAPGDGADYLRNNYSYEEGYYDRNERQFYGFGKVVDNQLNTEQDDAIARQVVYEFYNDNYYNTGKIKSITQQDPSGSIFRKSIYNYALKNIFTGQDLPPAFINNSGSAFPALVETRELFYEGEAEPGLQSSIYYQYDEKGNTISTIDIGDGSDNQFHEKKVSFFFLDDIHRYDKAKSIEEYTIEGKQRHIENTIDDIGQVTQIDMYINDAEKAVFNQEWDQYGNIIKVTRPKNYKDERLTYTYTYDDVIHDRIVKVEDGYGYSSMDSVNLMYDQLLSQTDMNGHRINYTIDHRGRTTSITGPKEIAKGIPYSIKYEYFPDASTPYSYTGHYNPGPENEIELYTFIDGLGREIQTKKTGSIYKGSANPDNEEMIVSGLNKYDCLGRLSEAYYPISVVSGPKSTISRTVDPISPTIHKYDVLDRVTAITFPNKGEYKISYTIDKDINSNRALKTSALDANGVRKDKYVDVQGRVIANRKDGPDGDIWNTFLYDGMSELIGSTDDSGIKTSYDYDWMGRKIYTFHPDAGEVIHQYDPVGNITKRITANLKADIPNGGGIVYQYDYERLVQIDYPKNVFNRVQLHYGGPDDKYNRAGRIWLQEDASGGQEFFFDPYGEAEKTIRSVLINGANLDTYVWESRYDTWNRMDTMIYPDGEVVDYTYNKAGKVATITGTKAGNRYVYVDQVGYDKFDQKVYLQYGNGIENVFEYRDTDRRLSAITSKKGNENVLDIGMQHDLEGNLLEVNNSMVRPESRGKLSTTFNHDYDQLYRIAGSTGKIDYEETQMAYHLDMEYDNLQNIRLKSQSITMAGDSLPDRNKVLDYHYRDNQPHIPSEIGGKEYFTDHNGNITGYSGSGGVFRYNRMKWDEENRLMGISQDGHITKITYDAGGNRVIRSSGGVQGVFINGEPSGAIDHHNNYIAHISPYFVKTDKAFYKHYFIGGHKFLLKEGLGNFDNKFWPNGSITAGNKNYIKRMQQLQVSVDNHYIELGIPPGPPTIQGINGQPEYTQSPLPISQITDYSGPPRNWPQPTFNPDTTGAPGPPVWFTTDSINNELVKAGFGFQDHKITAEIVNSYLHIDHTESTVGISDANGDITAIFSYSPFGEILYSENIKSDHTSSYRFNRKSFDQISQQYFYGSRYYDPETSIWNSVDPLSSQYPEWSPYAFSFHNPQTYIDRDGNFPGDLFSSPEKAAYDFGKIYNPLSININREYGARIQRVRSRKDGKHYYRYNPPVIGDKDGLDLGPKANGTIADVHTHGAWLPRYDNNEFSPADRHGNRSENTIGFVVTPNGFLKKYNPKTRKTEILSKKLPYDKKHYGPTNPYRSQKKTRPVSKGFRPGNAQNKRMAARWDFINDQGTAKKNNRKRPKPIRN